MQLKNNLYKIIRKEEVDRVVNYTIELSPSCVIYAAHFPSEPITPGVCIVQMGKELVEEQLSEQCSSPDETLHLTYQVKKLVTSEDGASVETQLIVLAEEKLMAKISLVLRTV